MIETGFLHGGCLEYRIYITSKKHITTIMLENILDHETGKISTSTVTGNEFRNSRLYLPVK